MSIHPRRHTRPAFTLAELIIVMMIIVLLLSILLPALNSARQRAKKVSAKAQVANIVSACESYMLAFSAAPGFASESLADGTNTRYLTSTENLVLSLLGGVINGTTGWVPTGWNSAAGFGTTRSVDFNLVGTGPIGKDGRSYGAFYSPKPSELAVITITDTAWWQANSMPELVDPGTGQPVLYYRATSLATPPVGTFVGSGQFVRGFNHVYTSGNVASPGAEAFNQTANSTLSNVAPSSNAIADVNLAWMIVNRQASTLGDGPNGANDLVGARFVLMSAGADGIYANKNTLASGVSITGTADVDNMDDIVMGGGG